MAIDSQYKIRISTEADMAGTEKAIGSHKELHEALHLVKLGVGDALGPLGELAHFLGNPYIMAIAGATLAIKMLVEQHQKLHENTVKQITASHDMVELFKNAHAGAVRTAAESVAEFNRALEHQFDHLSAITEGLDKYNAASKQALEHDQARAAASQTLAEALIHAAVAQGTMTKSEGEISLEMLHERVQARKDAAENAAKEREITADLAAADEARARAAELHGARGGMDADFLGKTEQKNAAAALLTTRQSEQKAAEDAAIEARVKSNDAANRFGPLSGPALRAEDKARAAEHAAEVARASVVAQANIVSQYDIQLADIKANIDANRADTIATNELARAKVEAARELSAALAAHKQDQSTAAAAGREAFNAEHSASGPYAGDANLYGPALQARIQYSLQEARNIIGGHRTGPSSRDQDMAEMADVIERLTALLANARIPANLGELFARLREEVAAVKANTSNYR